MNFIVYLSSINIVSFVIMFIDKRRAIRSRYRIPENLLLLLSLLSGCFGMLFGMYLFHHKTKKLKFKLVHILCVIWIIIFIKKGQPFLS